MDSEQNIPSPGESEEGYIPRPRWQVWGARVLVVIFILLVLMYYVNIARGGL